MRHEKIEPCPEEIQEEAKTPIGPKEFFDALEERVKGAVRMVIEKAINEEFNAFIGCLPYQMSPERRDHRNGYLTKDFETRFGVIEEISIPRARGGFFPSLFKR